jgi:hypothetical protein
MSAMLSPGEFVVNAKSARRYHSQLIAMNAGNMASGGTVGTTINGDFNISLNATGNSQVDAVRIGRLLQREIRRGTVKL